MDGWKYVMSPRHFRCLEQMICDHEISYSLFGQSGDISHNIYVGNLVYNITRYIDIRTDAMNAISLIDYQFSTYTPHAQFIQMMSNPLLYKIVSKVLFCILNKRRHIHFH